MPAKSFDLIYMDPPFNTGRAQSRRTLSVRADADGQRVGFGGRRYASQLLQSLSYDDAFADYLGFLEPRLTRARELLAPHGTLYFHIDYREAHYCKLLLDEIFGRDSFLNEIIWAYDYGARSKRRWPAKHDTILVYVKDPAGYYYDAEAVDREPYMAPGLVTPEKVVKGKLPTDVWWHTIVPTNGREKTGYPTQKPEGVIRRMIQASTRPED